MCHANTTCVPHGSILGLPILLLNLLHLSEANHNYGKISDNTCKKYIIIYTSENKHRDLVLG